MNATRKYLLLLEAISKIKSAKARMENAQGNRSSESVNMIFEIASIHLLLFGNYFCAR